MLNELGDETLDNSSIQIASVSNNISEPNAGNIAADDGSILNDALFSVRRLQEIEDIRAIFQILGIGS